jgi:hypothetical protein
MTDQGFCSTTARFVILLLALGALATSLYAHSEGSETIDLGNGRFVYDGVTFVLDHDFYSKEITYCWQQILDTHPWIDADQIECIENDPGFTLAELSLCDDGQREVTPEFQAYIDYTNEYIRVSEAMGEAIRDRKHGEHARLSVELERLERHWRLHSAYKLVYGTLDRLSSLSHSYECSQPNQKVRAHGQAGIQRLASELAHF